MKKKKRSGKNNDVNVISESLIVPSENSAGELSSLMIGGAMLPDILTTVNSNIITGEFAGIASSINRMAKGYNSDVINNCWIETDFLKNDLLSSQAIISGQASAMVHLNDINSEMPLIKKDIVNFPLIAGEVNQGCLNLYGSNQLSETIGSICNNVAKESLGFQSLAITATEINWAVDATIGLFHDSLRECVSASSVLDQAFFAVPSSLVTKEIDEFSRVSLVVDDFGQYGFGRKDHRISTVTTEERQYGGMILQAVQKTGMIVENMRFRIDGIDDRLLEQNKKLEKLLADCSEKGGKVVKVKSVVYKYKTFQLVIDGQCILIPAGTDRHDLCMVLFGESRNVWEPVELLGIMESFGVDMVNINSDVVGEWNRKISGAVRHLCDYIAKCSGPKDFLKYKKRVAFINPDYLGLVT